MIAAVCYAPGRAWTALGRTRLTRAQLADQPG
jgi:hypothetical protein